MDRTFNNNIFQPRRGENVLLSAARLSLSRENQKVPQFWLSVLGFWRIGYQGKVIDLSLAETTSFLKIPLALKWFDKMLFTFLGGSRQLTQELFILSLYLLALIRILTGYPPHLKRSNWLIRIKLPSFCIFLQPTLSIQLCNACQPMQLFTMSCSLHVFLITFMSKIGPRLGWNS